MGSEAQTSYRLSSPLRVFNGIEFSYGRDVGFKLPGQDGGEPLDGGIGVVHDGRRSVRACIVWDHVPRRHSLEVHDVVRRGHGEGSQDTEPEGALGVLGDPAT